MTSLHLQPHPLLGTPWFGVHPCRTADLMALLLPGGANGSGFRESVDPLGSSPAGNGNAGGAAGSRGGARGGAGNSVKARAAAGYGTVKQEADWPLRYLLAWFSVVGTAVGLRLPAAVWQLAARPP